MPPKHQYIYRAFLEGYDPRTNKKVPLPESQIDLVKMSYLINSVDYDPSSSKNVLIHSSLEDQNSHVFEFLFEFKTTDAAKIFHDMFFGDQSLVVLFNWTNLEVRMNDLNEEVVPAKAAFIWDAKNQTFGALGDLIGPQLSARDRTLWTRTLVHIFGHKYLNDVKYQDNSSQTVKSQGI